MSSRVNGVVDKFCAPDFSPALGHEEICDQISERGHEQICVDFFFGMEVMRYYVQIFPAWRHAKIFHYRQNNLQQGHSEI
jgi:hypothetical protein